MRDGHWTPPESVLLHTAGRSVIRGGIRLSALSGTTRVGEGCVGRDVWDTVIREH